MTYFFFSGWAQVLGLIKSREFFLYQFFNIGLVKLVTHVTCSYSYWYVSKLSPHCGI